MMPQTIKPYSESEGKKKQVRKMFNKIAPYYDLLNRVLSLGIDKIWRKKAILQLQERNPKIILDVATGTADLALEAAKRLDLEKITGVDISKEMLDLGKEKIRKKGLDKRITLIEADSENLPFEDNTFDAITVAFGVRNFENLEKGLKEMKRVLKKEGTVVILEFSRPNSFPFKQLFKLYFRNVLPLIGRMTSKDPKAYKYLYESVQAFPDGEDFLTVMQNTGFYSNKCIPLTLGICSIYVGQK